MAGETWQAGQIERDSSNQLMRNSNPAVIPRNHRVEAALEAAVQGDYSMTERLLDVLSNPYAHTADQAEYAEVPSSAAPYRAFYGIWYIINN